MTMNEILEKAEKAANEGDYKEAFLLIIRMLHHVKKECDSTTFL